MEAESHIHVLLDEVLRRGLACRFHAPNGLHARYIDRALAAKMYQAGFTTIRLGWETSNVLEQGRRRAKVTNSDFREAVHNLRAVGFRARQITAYILMGLPGQSAGEVMDSVDFVHKCGALVQITLYSLIPGTLEWERAVRQGHIDARADPLLHNDSIYPFPWSQASLEDFERAKARATAGNHALAASS